MFKAKNHLSPSFMNEMFEQNKGPSTRMGTIFVRLKVNSVYKRDNSLHTFVRPKVNSVYKRDNSLHTFVRPKVNSVYKRDNSLHTFVVWNSILPERLKVCSSLSEFKNALKSWIPENYTCRLCKHYVQGLGFIKQ